MAGAVVVPGASVELVVAAVVTVVEELASETTGSPPLPPQATRRKGKTRANIKIDRFMNTSQGIDHHMLSVRSLFNLSRDSLPADYILNGEGKAVQARK